MTLSIANEPTESIPLRVSDEDIIYVDDTRVTLDTVVEAFQDGATPEEIVYQYPSLHLADVYAVVSYYLRHRSLVEEYLAQRSQARERVRQQNESRFPSQGIRERLLARRQQQTG